MIALTMNPDAGMSAPEAFRDEELYAFRFDLDNDAREEVTFKVKLGPVSHSDGDERRHVQTFEVLRATGESALRGEEGDLIASGQTGETATTPDGCSAFAGLSPDIFAGDAAARSLPSRLHQGGAVRSNRSPKPQELIRQEECHRHPPRGTL